MSAEDLPEAVKSDNIDEGNKEVLKGVLLIAHENEEVKSEAKDETDNKYVMHEVIIEFMPSDDDDIKLDETMLVQDAAPDILSYDVVDVNPMDVSSNTIDISNATEIQEIHILGDQQTTDEINASNDDIESQKYDIDDITNVDEAVQEKSTNGNNVSNDFIETEDIHIAESTKVDKAIQENWLPEQIDTDCDTRQQTASVEESVLPIGQRGKVQLFTEDTWPQMYRPKGILITAPIITKNLPKVFDYLPIHGKPQDSSNLQEYFASKLREFAGSGWTDYEFQQMEECYSPEQLKLGNEVVMDTNVPVLGVINGKIIDNLDPPDDSVNANLCILKKNQMLIEKDSKGHFIKKLKYRGVRTLPFTQVENQMPILKPTEESPDVDLEPGKDILYRVRVYRPYIYSQSKDRFTRTRHSVFCYDIMLTGRNKLSDLRDRFVCHNDFDMRVDVSNHPDLVPSTKAKEVFPSGFLFINNVFYVDTREGCVDYSEPIREWARKKEIGVFPKKDMCAVRLEELTLKLGYPEVYVHQGHCEHLFLFSEIRLLNPTDPLRFYNYPCSTAVAQNQTVYCTTCAEYPAKWIVVGCSRVPFDPAFFCETCFRQYLYIDGKKIGDFKAYSYRGNALNLLKPQ